MTSFESGPGELEHAVVLRELGGGVVVGVASAISRHVDRPVFVSSCPGSP
jgi:hypothetical protein